MSKVKAQNFDHDPGWEGFNNHVQPKKVPTVEQDYGYQPRETGGRITRAARCTYYADSNIAYLENDELLKAALFGRQGFHVEIGR